MNDLKSLLDRAVPPQVSSVNVDPTADVARGRRQLRRRRQARAGSAVAGLGLLGVVTGAAITGLPGTDGPVTPTARPSSRSTPRMPSIALVAYSGRQIPGFEVSMVPQGWEIQGGNDYALVLAPKGFKDQDINSFQGKIAVMLQSAAAAESDASGAPDPVGVTTTKVTVGQTQGLFRVEAAHPATGSDGADPGGLSLTFDASKNQGVVVQVPLSLGWDSRQLIAFALGVKVLGNAKPGLG